MRKNIFMPVLFLAACAVFLNVAHADTAAPASVSAPAVAGADASDCTPTAADLKQISIIQNDQTLSYTEEIKAELAARKQLLGTTITCALGEAQTLQTSLAAVSATGDIANLQSQLNGRLDDTVNFYNIELTKLSGVGISGSEAIAKEVLAYRSGSYEPLAGDVNNFILWSGNQDLFATAQSRMDQTSRAVSFLESASPDGDLQNAFDAAQASFNDATSENQSAENALIQSLPATQSLSLIQQSLASLSDTYQQFFTVSNLIKTLLPQ
jgi:hypothetical protein